MTFASLMVIKWLILAVTAIIADHGLEWFTVDFGGSS